LTMCVLRLRMRFLRYMCSVRGSPIPLSPTIADTEADLPPTPGGAAAPSMQHPPPFEDVEDGEHDGSSKGDGVQREPSAGEPSTGSRRRTHKVHCFLILGRDYFHKQCRLSPRVVTHAAHVNATLQELFAQELFAQELLTPDRGSRLRVDGMEVQYMSVAGVPTLLTSDTPISAVLSSGAILVSDRPVAELVTQGCMSSDGLHARSCSSSHADDGACDSATSGSPPRKKAGKRQLGGGRRQRLLTSPARGARRLLMMISPSSSESLSEMAYHSDDHERAVLLLRRPMRPSEVS